MKKDIKQDILTVEEFGNERPDMNSFGEQAIQSTINTIAVLLDSECGGLIERVWYETNPDSPNYRNEWEKSQIFESFVSQTQFTLNLGNDFTQGSESFSIGGINGSFSRPRDRDVIAPGVYKLLQNARVYELQSFTNTFGDTPLNMSTDPMDAFISRNIGDKRYLQIDQPDVAEGRVARVTNGLINFEELMSVPNAINAENTDKILDPINNLYKFINQFSVNYFGGLTKEETYYAIAASGMVWNEPFNYRKGFIVQFTTSTNFLKFAESLVDDNVGNNPNTSPIEWKVLESQPIDESAIIEQLKPFISIEVTTQIDNLPDVTLDELVTELEAEGLANVNKSNTFIERNTFNKDIKVNGNIGVANESMIGWNLNLNISCPFGFGPIIITGDVQHKGRVDMLNNDIFNLMDGVNPKDAVNKSQLDLKQDKINYEIVEEAYDTDNSSSIPVPMNQILSIWVPNTPTALIPYTLTSISSRVYAISFSGSIINYPNQSTRILRKKPITTKGVKNE